MLFVTNTLLLFLFYWQIFGTLSLKTVKNPCDVTPNTKHVGLVSLLYDCLELEVQRARRIFLCIVCTK